MAFEAIDAGNVGKLRAVRGARGLDKETGVEHIASVRGDAPALSVFLPGGVLYPRLEQGQFVKAEVLAHPSRVLENLRGKGIFLLRHIARFFEQGQVTVGFNVALGTGVAVPIPGAAEIAAGFDE